MMEASSDHVMCYGHVLKGSRVPCMILQCTVGKGGQKRLLCLLACPLEPIIAFSHSAVMYTVLQWRVWSYSDLNSPTVTCTVLYWHARSYSDVYGLIVMCTILQWRARSYSDVHGPTVTCTVLQRLARSYSDVHHPKVHDPTMKWIVLHWHAHCALNNSVVMCTDSRLGLKWRDYDKKYFEIKSVALDMKRYQCLLCAYFLVYLCPLGYIRVIFWVVRRVWFIKFGAHKELFLNTYIRLMVMGDLK